ncbi:ABC transporter substrate-binding protein [Streptomyces sp. MP131-18]|uniref:ABC transporter substrate-binding protein n=1 Tax=Streptomyces sp. MP131-18 TaxID=1857892 RepID=UPI00097BDB49|nr:ABC transporter substrate-binding protein [Streptomyces sp. MP131-18]ONK09939.1 Oligopeptide-binding protein AppA precursor [Streptomyces sp. MP131-18]
MRVHARTRSTITAAGSALLALAVLAGCSGSSGPEGPGSGSGGVLNVGMPNGPQADNSNPFLDTSAGASLGYRAMIYEPLAMTNVVRPEQEPKPWLATAWEWAEDFTSVSFTIQDGPTWSDDEPFSAEDVAFTFELLASNDALNTAGIPYEDVVLDGSTVTVNFAESQFVNQTRILDTYIVPEHIWGELDAPETFENQEPVGTGPYVLESFTPQTVTLTRRDSYWQDLPAVEELRYTSYNDNNAQTTALANGDTEWSFVFMPDYENVFVDRDPENHKLWFPTGLGIHGLWINVEREPFDDPALRRAMAMVIDRQAIHEQAHAGLYPALENPTGLPLPAGESFLAPEYQGVTQEIDVEGARQVLEEAGYELTGDTLNTPEGEPVSLTLTDPAGWSDYLTALSIISDNLAEIGIEATVETQTVDAWTNSVNAGGFDATLHWTNTGATPYDMYQHIMDGDNYKPIGEASPAGNFGRFQHEEADQALEEYANATDEGTRTEALHTLQRILVEEVPMIPTVAGPIGAEYSTKNWVGWPTEEDPYAPPQPTQRGALDVVLNLEPANAAD